MKPQEWITMGSQKWDLRSKPTSPTWCWKKSWGKAALALCGGHRCLTKQERCRQALQKGDGFSWFSAPIWEGLPKTFFTLWNPRKLWSCSHERCLFLGLLRCRSRHGKMPTELIGLHQQDKRGRRMCYNFNMQKRCDLAPAGQMCPKGLHQCMLRSSGVHSAHQCSATVTWQPTTRQGRSQPPFPITLPIPAVKPQLAPGTKRSFDSSFSFAEKFRQRVHGVNIADLVFIEVFSGTVGLTASVRRMGCQHSAGIDAHVTKQVRAPVIWIDLANAHGQQLLWRILEQPKLFGIHLGPPCGTSSRARDIRRRFGSDPKPLRSVEFPDGLPNLSARDKARVHTANPLYKLSGEILSYATANGILCSLENPLRSHMWNTTYLTQALQSVGAQLHEMLFHHCMFGSQRKKRTKLLVNHSCYNHLNRACDGSHAHEPWGQTSNGRATAQEVAWMGPVPQVGFAWARCTRPPRRDVAAHWHEHQSPSLRPLMREYSHIIRVQGPLWNISRGSSLRAYCMMLIVTFFSFWRHCRDVVCLPHLLHLDHSKDEAARGEGDGRRLHLDMGAL